VAPPGSRFKGCQDMLLYEQVISAEVVGYRWERWVIWSGATALAPLAAGVVIRFGPGLLRVVLVALLGGKGIEIFKRQVVRPLTSRLRVQKKRGRDRSGWQRRQRENQGKEAPPLRRDAQADAARRNAHRQSGWAAPDDSASDVWADTAYRSAENERYMAGIGRVHRRKPRGRSMPRHNAKASAAKSAVRAHVEHPFAHQKGFMGLMIRTIALFAPNVGMSEMSNFLNILN